MPTRAHNSVGSLSGLPDITKEPRFRVRVLGNTAVAGDSFTLSLERPSAFTFTPGQYIWLVVPRLSLRKGHIDRRAYSLSSGIDAPILELFITVTASEYLSYVKALKKDDTVDIIGPMGSGFIVPASGAVMIGAGSGLAPFLSIMRSHVQRRLSLYVYHTPEQSVHCADELSALARMYCYEVIFCPTRPKRGDFDRTPIVKDKRPIFISGTQNVVDSVTRILRDIGVPRERFHYEATYPLNAMDKTVRGLFAQFYKTQTHDTSPRVDGWQEYGLGELFLQVTKQTNNHVVLTDSGGYIVFANTAAEQITGYTFHEMQGQTPRLWGGLLPPSFYSQKLWSHLLKQSVVKMLFINRHRDGHLYTAIGTMTPIVHGGQIIAYVSTEEDISTLQEIDKAKTEFVSLASHELRTPLSVIHWYAQMLMSDTAGTMTAKQKTYLNAIYASNQRMIGLVNTLLNVSRIELGTLVSDPEPIDIGFLIADVLSEQKPHIDAKHIAIEKQWTPALPFANADPKLLRIVFQNLISNAVKYTPIGGTIILHLASGHARTLLFTITDTGYGIPQRQQGRMFSKLFRADNVREKNTEGTGLGLYITKAIIEQSGGKIWFESPAVGGELRTEYPGTTFYVTLPLNVGTSKKRRER